MQDIDPSSRVPSVCTQQSDPFFPLAVGLEMPSPLRLAGQTPPRRRWLERGGPLSSHTCRIHRGAVHLVFAAGQRVRCDCREDRGVFSQQPTSGTPLDMHVGW